MPADRDPTRAWIAIPPADELPAEVRDEIGDVSERIGFMPNVARLLAVTPGHFVGWWKYVRLATATGLYPNVEYHELGRTTAA